MTTTAEPKWSIWLGDNWPGPYVVTYTFRKGRSKRIVVVNGVLNPAEALAIAQAELEIPEDEIEDVSITIGHVAEATHHMQALKEFRDKEDESGTAQ